MVSARGDSAMTLKNDYASLFSATQSERETKRLTEALDVIKTALEQGAIRNAVFKDAKTTIDRAIESGWSRVQGVYLSIPYEVREVRGDAADAASSLYFGGCSGAHGLLFLRKKIQTATKNGSPAPFDAFYAAADAFEAELIELAKAIRTLKGAVIKGREPAPAPALSNPDQIRGTCPCCFANQAVRGTMVHHGYQRPGEGYQTASCPGIRFKPYERSPDGVLAMIDSLEAQITDHTQKLADKENWPSVTMMARAKRSAKHLDGTALVTVERGSKDWDRAYRAEVRHLEAKIEAAQSNLSSYLEKKAAWKLQALHKADGTVMPLTFEG